MWTKALSVLGISMVAASLRPGQATEAGMAQCQGQTMRDPCRVSWTFGGPSKAFFWVQRLDGDGKWNSLSHAPDGAAPGGSRSAPVEGGRLYRVLACGDVKATRDCVGSTMVWAPLVYTPEQLHLIPSHVLVTRPDGGQDSAMIFKDADWLTQVIQYNVYQLSDALALVDTAELPDMTPAPDLRFQEAKDPMEQIQFNVWAVYLARQGRPLDMPQPPRGERKPHVHPERDGPHE